MLDFIDTLRTGGSDIGAHIMQCFENGFGHLRNPGTGFRVPRSLRLDDLLMIRYANDEMVNATSEDATIVQHFNSWVQPLGNGNITLALENVGDPDGPVRASWG